MFAQSRLRELESAKRIEVLKSDLHRGILRVECAKVGERLCGFRSTWTRMGVGRPLLLVAAAVAGGLAVRHWKTVVRWAPSALAAWRWVRRRPGQ